MNRLLFGAIIVEFVLLVYICIVFYFRQKALGEEDDFVLDEYQEEQLKQKEAKQDDT